MKKKKYSKRHKTTYKKALAAKSRSEEVLNEMLTCDTVCGDLGTYDYDHPDFTVNEIDELIAQLPGVDYVLDRMLNYMFSNGLTTGQESLDTQKLNPWLYDRKNKIGSTNYETLQSVIGQAALYGECGMRVYEDDLYLYKKGTYGMLLSREDGIDEVVAFFIREDGKNIDKDFDLKSTDFSEWQSFADYFRSNQMILLDADEFVNIRNDTTYLHGQSPFLHDRQRLDLLLSVYERLNYDIDYDGPGRIILRPKDSFISATDNDISTGKLIDNSPGAQEKRNEKAKAEMQRVAREMKTSGSDQVILLSNAFSDNIEHLPRVTKATEFFDWISNDTVVLAQMLKMSPTLLEVGKLHGNVSVEKIIDNAMLNTIIPQRETYAVQFTGVISRIIGVQKVYFDKYDLEQIQDENDMRMKVSTMIRDLSYAEKSNPSENTRKLIDELDDFLRSSIYDDNGKMRTL